MQGRCIVFKISGREWKDVLERQPRRIVGAIAKTLKERWGVLQMNQGAFRTRRVSEGVKVAGVVGLHIKSCHAGRCSTPLGNGPPMLLHSTVDAVHRLGCVTHAGDVMRTYQSTTSLPQPFETGTSGLMPHIPLSPHDGFLGPTTGGPT